eukprot:1390954-Amorphochlora_amoeboformis.AAC.1
MVNNGNSTKHKYAHSWYPTHLPFSAGNFKSLVEPEVETPGEFSSLFGYFCQVSRRPLRGVGGSIEFERDEGLGEAQ